MMTSLEYTGLDTRKALGKLKADITKELQIYEEVTWKRQSCISALGHQSGWKLDPRAAFHWTSGVAIVIAIVLLLLSSVFRWDPSLLVESAVLFMFLCFNAYLSGWDCRLQHREMVDRTKELIKQLEGMISQEVSWTSDDYLPLFSPHTNSIMLQWTLRDGQLVNLPWTLLVTDDIILMRPGKIAPTNIRILSDESNLELQAGEVYHPIIPEPQSEPTARHPLKPAKFQVMDTPFIPHLRTCLKGAQKKPLSSFDNKRINCTAAFERWLTPAALIISFVINMIRYLIFEPDMGHWAEVFIAIPVHTVLPLLPLCLPLIWISLNHFGCARIVTLFHKSKHLKVPESDREFQDSDEDTPIIDENLPWLPVWWSFKSSFLGTSAHLPRTGNLLQGLGSVTSLCCVDKRGILSTPDPNPEKVFFMSSLSDDDSDSVCSEDSVFGAEDRAEKGKKRQKSKLLNEDHFPEHHAEVLTLSQDPSGVHGVEFDETNWDRHISSLKPMGLTILMNTCNSNTVETYCSFMDHVSSSVNNEESKHYMHVSQRRCLCQIALVLGFTDQATEAFELKQKLALYKLPSDGDENDVGGRRFARSRSFIKKRIPAPHTLSVLVEQPSTDYQQLLTQGSASLLLDLCSEFWDGSDLYTLTENERKKILDFYQRATLSSYCTAFAYQPMAETIDNRLGDYYIELPANHKHTDDHYMNEIPGLARSSWDMESSRDPNTDIHRTRKYHSLDSTMNKHGKITNAEECYKSQCGQIFIGMVTSNYQAKADIVALIEQLDNACIRFVHFSRDQELRSRVFSEKLGLEAGWNCHISLLDQDSSSSSSSHLPHTGDVSRQFSSHSSSGHDNTITDGEMSNRHSDTGEPKSDGTETSPHTADEEQVQIEVEAQRVRFDPVEAVVVVDMESLIEDEDIEKGDVVAKQQTSDASQPCESVELSMRGSEVPNLSRPCSRDADTEDVDNDDEEEEKDETDGLQKLSSSSFEKSRTTSYPLPDTSCVVKAEPKEEDALLGDRHRNVASSNLSSPSSTNSQSIPASPPPQTEEANANNSEDTKETDALLSQPSTKPFDLSNRHRQISETQTFNSDVSAAETDTLSHHTESETAGGFDISNRAKLPRGIANIRPHIERIDNVPLLVPLFTDVTPETTREMVEIMQENGEVVCCLGSSLNITNAPIFAQADISIGMEPLPPHICMSKEHAHPKAPPNWTSSHPPRTPLEISSLLTSLPCSLSFHRLNNISLISLIREARGVCNGMVNCFTFFMFGLLTLSAIQLLCTLLFLPPPVSGRHVLWLAAVIIPLLAMALMGSNSQSKVMTQATGKNVREHNSDHVMLFCFYFITKFLGSVIICTVCHFLTLFAFCKKTAENPTDCHFILHNRNLTSSWNGWRDELSSHHVLAQNIQAFLLTFYFITSSASFVHSLQPMWRKPPFRNHLWCGVVCALFILEIVFFAIDMSLWGRADAATGMPSSLEDIPLEVWLIGFLWPLVELFICEAVKQYEIQVFVRWQKRTKLQFGTKLGMNSPF
ncbi:transmembrane protein 94-like [Lytechinus pictus]|uniref:transmembrane protein 94-like n=1 Tax=Lytechinus pictus TaxID=7653 RepID=UPI0030B9AE0F